jgi:L-alanine-DL-glutamate epimerase-like enolase superfamily enzyme
MARRRDLDQETLELQVDANGGWDLATAQGMLPWLADQGVVLVEQPLAALADPLADRAGFTALSGLAPLALVADESCWDLADLLRLAPVVDGINIKLLKSGGLSEALLMARCARRLGLGVMLGCYSDSSLLNSAAAQLLPLVEWPDLDSHLNLVDDPFEGAVLEGDCLRPSPLPGLGVSWAPGFEIDAAGGKGSGGEALGDKVSGGKAAGAKAAGAKAAGTKASGAKASGGRRPAGGKSKAQSEAQALGPQS